MIYYNNRENRQAYDFEVNAFNMVNNIIDKVENDDFIFIMDTIKGYDNNNGFHTIEDVENIADRYNVKVSALILWYDIEIVC